MHGAGNDGTPLPAPLFATVVLLAAWGSMVNFAGYLSAQGTAWPRPGRRSTRPAAPSRWPRWRLGTGPQYLTGQLTAWDY